MEDVSNLLLMKMQRPKENLALEGDQDQDLGPDLDQGVVQDQEVIKGDLQAVVDLHHRKKDAKGSFISKRSWFGTSFSILAPIFYPE